MVMRKNIYYLLVLCVFTLSSFSDKDELTYKNKFYELTIDKATGSIKSIIKDGKNKVDTKGCAGPIFNIRLRNQAESGKVYEYNALQAKNIDITFKNGIIRMSYSGFEDPGIEVLVTATLSKSSQFMRWNISVSNDTPNTLEHIDFPNIVVNNDLIATGGTGHVFWPGLEGCLIDDLKIRENSWLRHRPIEYPFLGFGGLYPSSVQMQYMAHYNADGGLYLAAHDSECNPKGIEFYRTESDGIKLDFRLFTGGYGKGTYTMPYDMILGTFDGDWYDASAIYRDWRESSDMVMPPKIKDNQTLPEWYFESPVVIIYPVRGHRDMGDMTPNEFFPYVNGLKHVDKYNQGFDSKIMALLMHWEGSAPWCPPYVWPPYGGEAGYQEFVDALHEKGNLIGLYASGIGYTLKSNTDPTYNMYKEYKEKGLSRVMKVAPDGNLATNGVCAGPNAQRIGYDMCPSDDYVTNTAVQEISSIIKTKTDYIQYFDQNLGGACYACYGTEHGHPYGPGLWQTKKMQDLYSKVMPVLNNSGYKPLLGCEAAAAEGNLTFLQYNDNRAFINLNLGTPVPAYAFVYHEYINNFMGNQCGTREAVDFKKSPMNMLQRLAYGFCAGDMLSVILRGNGDMIWDWGTTWETDIPDQQNATELIKNLNGWRKGAGKEYLTFGRMQKPLPIKGLTNIPMISKGGDNVNFDNVFSSNWRIDNGTLAQFFVNYMPHEQQISIDVSKLKGAKIYTDAYDDAGEKITEKCEFNITIAPLSAVMVSYK